MQKMILKAIRDAGGTAKFRTIVEATNLKGNTVSRSILHLKNRELIKRKVNYVYEIHPNGRKLGYRETTTTLNVKAMPKIDRLIGELDVSN